MPMEDEFIEAAYQVGGQNRTLVDAYSGDHYGFYSSLGAVDRTGNKGTRSYAASGYLKPNLGRGNLKVLTEALVSRVMLENGTAGQWRLEWSSLRLDESILSRLKKR